MANSFVLSFAFLALLINVSAAAEPKDIVEKACAGEECAAVGEEESVSVSLLQTQVRTFIDEEALTQNEGADKPLAESGKVDGVTMLLQSEKMDEDAEGRRRRRRRKKFGFNMKKKLKKLRRKASKAARAAVKVASKVGSAALTVAKAKLPSVAKLKAIGANALKTADAIGTKLATIANKIGSTALASVKSLGPLIMSAAASVGDALEAALDALTSLFDFSCLDFEVMMCRAVLPMSLFDCTGGSKVSLSIGSTPTATIEMVPKDFSKLFGLKTSKTAWNTRQGAALGGISGRSSNAPDMTSLLMPIGSSPISVAVDAEIEFQPKITVDLSPTDPKATITVSGILFAKLNALVMASGSSTYTKKVMLPTKPLTVTACSGMFCVICNLQAQAILQATATALGSAGFNAMAQLTVSATIELDLSTGDMSQSVELGALDHEEDLDMDASFSGSVKLSVGPLLSILALPGAPVNIQPLVSLEVKTHSEASAAWDDDTGLNEVDTCGAASVNFLATTNINALGIPADLSFSSTELKDAYIAGLAAVPINLVNAIEKTISDCLGDAADGLSAITNPLKAAAEALSGAAASLIPDFDLSFPLPTSLLDETTCETLFTANLPVGGTCGTTDLGCPRRRRR